MNERSFGLNEEFFVARKSLQSRERLSGEKLQPVNSGSKAIATVRTKLQGRLNDPQHLESLNRNFLLHKASSRFAISGKKTCSKLSIFAWRAVLLQLNLNNAKASIDNLMKAVNNRDIQIVDLKKEIDVSSNFATLPSISKTPTTWNQNDYICSTCKINMRRWENCWGRKNFSCRSKLMTWVRGWREKKAQQTTTCVFSRPCLSWMI